MGLPVSTRPDARPVEAELLRDLLDLYAQQGRIYQRVLELSRQQGETIRRGGSLGDVRFILEEKRSCLDEIKELERRRQQQKATWESGRRHWTADAKARMHAALQGVGRLIEEILMCEERNDMELINQAKEF